MAVVESESYSSWSLFLLLLIDDLDLRSGNGYTLISDQQKGLDKVVREFLPQVEHRFCARHLSSNLIKKEANESVKLGFWAASTATFPEAFKTAIKDLEKHLKKAAGKMKTLDPKCWSHAYYETYSKYASVENNLSESFNSWILRCKCMPLIDMLTEIYDMLMERIHRKRDVMKDVDCIVLPKIRKVLAQTIKDSNECRVLWDGRENFQVKWRGISYCMNLQEGTCSCRVWELTGIPCSHAISAIQKMRNDPVDFVSHWFKKEAYTKTYSYCLEVIKGKSFWEEVLGDTVLPSLYVKQLRGRPKK
ncbi:uncharacterized protein LOC141680667 [Apium graveolens]|uniref:uncharacterized protein LOC141680667 n=1 Tax=Apium graveolens TaxID=4045 RepID=UPI003D7AAA42